MFVTPNLVSAIRKSFEYLSKTVEKLPEDHPAKNQMLKLPEEFEIIFKMEQRVPIPAPKPKPKSGDCVILPFK